MPSNFIMIIKIKFIIGKATIINSLAKALQRFLFFFNFKHYFTDFISNALTSADFEIPFWGKKVFLKAKT